jgi:hypothetical protein
MANFNETTPDRNDGPSLTMTPLRDSLADFIVHLRAEGRALQGDGFGYIGKLKSTYKKTCKQMEELLEMIDNAAKEVLDTAPTVAVDLEIGNEDCMGSLPNCQCRKIFDNIKK